MQLCQSEKHVLRHVSDICYAQLKLIRYRPKLLHGNWGAMRDMQPAYNSMWTLK